MSREIKFTYQQYKILEKFPSNIKLALSEFIDNSISSFQNKDINNHVNGLNIKITFDWRDEKNRKIIIVDNANGMSPSVMEESMQPGGNPNEKSDNGLNQFGLGMKQGAFFIGQDVCIYSKEKEKEEYKLEVCTSKSNYNDVVTVEAIKSSDNMITSESGTIIIISHVYDNDDKNVISKKDKFDSLKDSLSMRYGKLIDAGMNIKLEILHDVESIRRWPYEKEKKNDMQTSDEYGNIINFKFPKLQLNKLLHHKDFVIAEKRDEKFKNMKKSFKKIILDNNKPLLIEAYNKFIQGNELSFKKEININGHPCELIFGIFGSDLKNKQKYCGLTIYHANRAIIHGPREENNKIIDFVEDIKASNELNGRWLFGALDLTNIETPDTNKRDFSWTTQGKQDLRNELDKIYSELKPLLEGIASINNEKNQLGSRIDLIDGANDFTEKTGIEYDHEIDENGDDIIKNDKFFIDGKKYKIELNEIGNSNSLVESYLDEIYNKIKITISSNNKFWTDPSLSSKGIRGKVEFPISVFIGVMNILWSKDELREKYKKESLSSLFNKIIYGGKI